MSKIMPIDLANVTNKKAIEFAQRCDKAGIAPLRSVANRSKSSAIASMGDGVLAVSGRYAEDMAKLKSPEIALKEAREGWKASLDYHQSVVDKYDTLEKRALYKETIDEAKKEIRRLKKLLKDDAAGLERIGRAASSWKPGDSDSLKPFNAEAYFASNEQKWEMVLENEFAHHIHQMIDVTDVGSYEHPPLEARLIKMFKNRGTSASLYGEGQGVNRPPMEWFAENRGLWKMGRADLVDETIKPLMKELDDKGL